MMSWEVKNFLEGHERTGLNWREQNESGDLLEPAHLLLDIMN